MKTLVLIMVAFIFFCGRLSAQTLYVDGQKGKDDAKGTLAEPLASLQKAVALARNFSGSEPITIKLGTGVYELHDKLTIETKNDGNGAAKYTLEATVMPDDKDWKPSLMPVIQSVSSDNDKQFFDHCAGILADRANVCIRGLKFVGNTNPAVEYYYPVEKDTTTLENLEISQCYFIGDRYGSVVQGAIYAQAQGIQVDHCIFFGCKNAVLVFQNLKRFSLTHSIIYDAYECAVWYGAISENGPEAPFTFTDNVVSHCRYVWAATKAHDHGYYTFNHSLITGNENYVGMQDGNGGVIPMPTKESYYENNIHKTGTVKLVEVQTEGFPKNYLNLAPESAGKDIDAGIFKFFK